MSDEAKQAKFTPGDWRVKESKVPGYERNIDVVAGDLLVCEVTGGGVSNPVVLARVRANARLLAAAKALYEALANLAFSHDARDRGDGCWCAMIGGETHCERNGVHDEYCLVARAAIALVDGPSVTEGETSDE